MLNFSEYKKYEYLPVVHFEIHRETEKPLLEELHAYMPPHFLGTVHDLPENNDFTEHDRHSGIYTHPDHSDRYFVFHGSNALPFDNIEDAKKHMWNMDMDFKSSTNDIAEVLKPHYSASKYSADDLDAIETYTKDSRSINRALIKKQKLLGNRLAEVIHGMDSALDKIHTPDDLVVYTGTNFEHAKTLMNNPLVEHPGYISTSTNILRAHRFAETGSGHIIRIHVPANHPGIYAEEYSDHPREQEFILPRNLKLRIDKSKQMLFRETGNPNKVIVHDATILI